MSKRITDKEFLVYCCIREFIIENRYSPSYRELSDLTGIKSSSCISRYLHSLKDKGIIYFTKGVNRSIVIKKKVERRKKII